MGTQLAQLFLFLFLFHILNKMIRTIVVDDEKYALSAIVGLIELQFPDISIVATAESVDEAFQLINKHQPELILLDVQIHDKTGFDLLKQFSSINFKVIFITAHNDYAIKAFKFSAVDYILKPIDVDELALAIQKAKNIIEQESFTKKIASLLHNHSDTNKNNQKIVLKTQDRVDVVNINDIIRCEADLSYTTFHFLNRGKIMVSKTLKEYDELLSHHNFFRIHQSHLINMNYLQSFKKNDGGFVVMKDNSEIPVASRKKDQLLKLIQQ